MFFVDHFLLISYFHPLFILFYSGNSLHYRSIKKPIDSCQSKEKQQLTQSSKQKRLDRMQKSTKLKQNSKPDSLCNPFITIHPTISHRRLYYLTSLMSQCHSSRDFLTPLVQHWSYCDFCSFLAALSLDLQSWIQGHSLD